MANLRTSFAVLEDFSTGAGLALHNAVVGQTVVGKNALAGLVAQDPSNNFQYLNLDVSGNLKTVSVSSSACLSAAGSAPGASGMTTVATLTLTASKMYKEIAWIAGCSRDAEYQIVWNNNGTPVVVAEGIFVGAGCETSADSQECLSMTAGGTGTQELLLKAANLFGYTSDMKGTLSCLQV